MDDFFRPGIYLELITCNRLTYSYCQMLNSNALASKKWYACTQVFVKQLPVIILFERLVPDMHVPSHVMQVINFRPPVIIFISNLPNKFRTDKNYRYGCKR